MASILVIYGTGEGQTAKIADRLVTTLVAAGHDADAVDIEAASGDLEPSAYDAVIVGSSIHVGRPNPRINGFVENSLAELEHRPTAFFLVCLSAALPDEESQAKAASYVDDFLETTGWHPDRIGLFGGAFRYSEYGFVKRAMIKRIAKKTTGDTDTSQDYEYTDWDEVDAFATDFADYVAGTEAEPPADG